MSTIIRRQEVRDPSSFSLVWNRGDKPQVPSHCTGRANNRMINEELRSPVLTGPSSMTNAKNPS